MLKKSIITKKVLLHLLKTRLTENLFPLTLAPTLKHNNVFELTSFLWKMYRYQKKGENSINIHYSTLLQNLSQQ